MKRLDLQAIRGIAIFLVILFHLQPQAFSFGFVGVDIFFVLSGYLMALILSKETFSKASVCNFYSRRFRRIVPLYFMVLLLVFIDKKQLLLDLKNALGFYSNMQYLYEVPGYWEQVNKSRFFVHCWSLALEIQFYAIAPFIIFLSHRFDLKTRNIHLLIFITASCSLQILVNNKVGYYLLLCRIWQFLLGILCFQEENGYETLRKDQVEKSDKPAYIWNSSDCIIILIVFLVILNPPFEGKDHFFRIFSCISIAFVISKNGLGNPGIILSNNFLVYLGNLSYTMYLVHWPIIVGYKYYYNLQFLSIKNSFLAAVAILLVALLVHYIFEKQIITFSNVSSFFICFSCLGFIFLAQNFYLSYFKPYYYWQEMDPYKIEEIIKWNEAEVEKTLFPLPCQPDNITATWTNFTEDPNLRCQTHSNGTLKILIIGNSIAYRAFPKIYELLQGKYKELRLFARAASIPLANDPESYPEFTPAARIVAEKMKPDILWNIHVKSSPEFTSTFNIEMKNEDNTFLQFQNNLDFYSSQAKEVIIDLPYYWSNVPAAYHIAKRFYQGDYDLSDLKIPKQEVEKQQFYHKQRLLALDCNNCHFTDIEQEFYENDGFYYLYDRKNYHAYTNDGNHLTPPMLDRIALVYQQIIEEVIGKLALNENIGIH